jgi:phosphatidylglycerophosphate synthase
MNIIQKYFKKRRDADFVRKIDYWSLVFFMDFFAIPLAEFLHKNTKLTANQVTFLSGIAGTISAAFFFAGGYANLVWGAIFHELYFLFDCVDGKLARLRHSHSNLGFWLDLNCGRYVNLISFVALAWSQFYVAGGVNFLATGLGLIFLHYTLHFIHNRLAKKNGIFNEDIGNEREIWILNKKWGQKFIDHGLLPSVFTYQTHRFLIFFVGPVTNHFELVFIISLGLFTIFKVMPELLLFLSSTISRSFKK